MKDTIVNYLLKNKIFDINTFSSTAIDVDAIIIGIALSHKHVDTTSFKLIKYLKERYKINYILCGWNTGWVIVDLKIIIVHLMITEIKIKYELDKLYLIKFDD